MNRVAETSQFYGVEVSQFNIHPLRNQAIQPQVLAKVNQENAHIIAHAFQNGYPIPSDSRITRTIKKNTDGADKVVYRLDRAFQRYRNYNSLAYVFKKQPKVIAKSKGKGNSKGKDKNKAKNKKKQIFQVQSPQQIVIKCARAAYIRSLLTKDNLAVEKKQRILPQSVIRRKEHQKQRRLQRTLLIKTYKSLLLNIYGNIIFRSGWKIGRQQLKEKLDLPEKSYNVEHMKNTIALRQKEAAGKAIIFMQKKKAYQKQKMQRMKILKARRLFFKQKYFFPYSSIKHYREQNLYEKKRQFIQKEKAARQQSQILMRKKRRKMRKQKIYYRQKSNPNNKQIQKQAKESTFNTEDAYEELYQDQDLIQLQEKYKDNLLAQ